MKFAACSIVIACITLSSVVPAAADRSTDAGQLFLWLLGLNTPREPGIPHKLDLNAAKIDELAAMPGLDRNQAQRIIANRPYATVQDLVRAGLSRRRIERLSEFVTIGPETPSASPGAAPPGR